MRMLKLSLLLWLGLGCLACGCSRNGAQDSPGARQTEQSPAIPLLTFSDAHSWKTDLGSNFGIYLGPEEQLAEQPDARPVLRQTLEWEQGNAHLSLRFERLRPPHQFAGLWLSVFGHIGDREVALPAEVGDGLVAVRFRARAPEAPVRLKVEAKTPQGRVVDRYFDVAGEWQTFTMSLPQVGLRPAGGVFAPQDLKELVFVIESRFQSGQGSNGLQGALELDDVSLICKAGAPFEPPQEERALLDWTRDRGLHYFIWNYREREGGQGFVLERNSFHDLVSVAGVGYAFPAFIVAGKQGLLSAEEARSRVLAMLRWLDSLECANGKGGWHGFPYHFLHPDGTRAGTSEVGTIDWAICAAGIRVARQQYADDADIKPLATTLLARPDWEAATPGGGRVSHGFGADGKALDTKWGSSFTEEAHLVAMEGVASGGLASDVFAGLKREKRSGFWPSWFGSGFTYNWLQLWTGPREPFATNSRRAYEADARFCAQRHGRPVMGCTACETFSGKDEDGFLKWDIYGGKMGSDVHLAEDRGVDHRSVCPYGAALALPFTREQAVEALLEYMKLGFVHPLLGLPDSVRMEDLPGGAEGPVPNWTQFAIDAGPMWMAVEACGPDGGRVAELYLADDEVKAALKQLDSSMEGWEGELAGE